MKSFLSKLLFVLIDLLAIVTALLSAFILRNTLDFFPVEHTIPLSRYLEFAPLYIVLIGIFAYEEIYTRRYDFWHETRLVFQGLLFGFFIIMAYLALSRTIEHYSRAVFLLTFCFAAFYIPAFKRLAKFTLYRLGWWQKPARVLGDDKALEEEIYSNPYLGYIHPGRRRARTVFIRSGRMTPDTLRQTIDKELTQSEEVIFVPLLNDFNLTQSHIYELFNTQTNLIALQNRLKSRYRVALKSLFDYTLSLLLLPFLLPIIAVLAVLIKAESPGPVFFVHRRIGKGGKTVGTVKFRSMYKDADERLRKLLKEDPAFASAWRQNRKVKEDPRVTKIGAFLRRTSLDELPQIFNVLLGQMSLVGPRPVVKEEIDEYYKEDAEYYYSVKPGITGLWQVSGRSEVDYDRRVYLDKWYVRNWSLWLDIVILLKTVRVVLRKEGAY